MSKKEKPDHHWKDPNESHKPRDKRRLHDPDVYFTLKVASLYTGRSHRSLKFTVDFNPPFQTNVGDVEPYYVSATNPDNVELFREILEHVAEVYRYISDPVNYQPKDGNHDLTQRKSTDPHDRRTQQERLAEIIKLTDGRINHFFYEQASNNMVGVGAVALSDGNGDPRPPRP